MWIKMGAVERNLSGSPVRSKAFHIVFPAFTIGLSSYIAVPERRFFSVIAVLPFLPPVPACAAFVFWTFRGKTGEGGVYR